jgi:hypothetical protein
MKQLNSDFSKAKVGDKVYHVNGNVQQIVKINRNRTECEIIVDEGEYYEQNGKYYDSDVNPTIFTHPVKIIHADDEPFVERVMEVSNNSDFIDKNIRVVFAQKHGYFIAWNAAETIEQAKHHWNTSGWRFAREIQPVNPRIADVESQIQRLQNELETLKEVGK